MHVSGVVTCFYLGVFRSPDKNFSCVPASEHRVAPLARAKCAPTSTARVLAAGKRRYLFKVQRSDGADPLGWREHEMVQDASPFPQVQFTDIKDYVVHTSIILSRDQRKAYESPEAYPIDL